ncbi:MAG: DUF362 domain-containing protein [Deltaproteobacteria bacterium]|nr:DUF362 domain-containing protein [Deltaproteobacteria bacterium]
MAKVIIKKANYENLSQIIQEIFEVFPIDLHSKNVFIKPNLVRPAVPEKAATTHPALVKAIAEEVKRGGGRPWIGDNGIDIQTLYEVTEMEKTCAPYMVNISKEAKLFEIGGYRVPISSFFVDMDIFINVPKLKTHQLAGMTCCLKNPFGLIPGNFKSRMHALSGHAKKLTEFFVDLYRWRIPDLNVVDGILGMEGDGPSFGTPREVGRIIAGKDGIAVDAVCARMIGFENPRNIKLIDLAEKKGLGQFDLNHLQVEGPFEVIGNFVHPSTYTANIPGKKSPFAPDLEKYLQGWNQLGRVMPVCNEALCTRCEDCLSACPSEAIGIEPQPKIDPEKCLSCFCCVEVCKEKVFIIPMQELQERRIRMGM